MTYDELLSRGAWGTGSVREIRVRECEYTVDGVRLGGLEFETFTGSPNDTRFSKARAEIETAAFLLARLGYEHVLLFTRDSAGKKLPGPGPDLEADLPGGRLGLEVAEAIAPAVKARDAEVQRIEIALRDLCDRDAAFKATLGDHNVSIVLSTGAPSFDLGKKEALGLLGEIERFIRNGGHHQADDEEDDNFPIPERYSRLAGTGARCFTSVLPGGHISVSEGAHFVNPRDSVAIALGVLDDHRLNAKKYRPVPTWMVMFISDPSELFRNTVARIGEMNPPIDPFERCYVSDVAGNLLTLPSVILAAPDHMPVGKASDAYSGR